MSNPNFIKYCNDCAEKKGYPKTSDMDTGECQLCGLDCFLNVKEARLLTIYEKPNLDSIEDTYFDTSRVSDDDYVKYANKATGQAEKILKFFMKSKKEFTPSEIHMNLFDESTPITSIRRAMSNLSSASMKNNFNPPLQKLDKQKDGPYGRPEYYWKFKTKQ
jgi:hypothetical protein